MSRLPKRQPDDDEPLTKGEAREKERILERWKRSALVGFIILIAGVSLAFAKVEGVVSENKEAGQNQLNNRVANVHVWCGAINENRDEGRARALKTPGAPPFKLKDLDCARIEYETAHSALGKNIPIPKWVK